MKTLTLIRDLKRTVNYEVRGHLLFDMENEILILPTKENLLHLCPEGKYIIRYEFSPKFNRNLWELYGVSKRSEIKFHIGNAARESKGCILLGVDSLDKLHSCLDNSKDYLLIVKNL